MKVLQYTVQNYRSFRDETTLSFVSSSRKDAPEHRIPSTFTDHGILPVVGLWGANAAGKSNLLKALLFFRQHVLESFLISPTAPLPWEPFMLDATGEPTVHDLDFELDGTRYRYGFTHNDQRYLEEWLYEMPENRWRRVFERDATGEPEFVFGSGFRGQRSSLVDQTRPNALLLSTAAQLNHPHLKRLWAAITQGIQSAGEIQLKGNPLFAENAPIIQEANREYFRTMLEAIDIGCSDFETEKLKPGIPKEVLNMFQPDVRKQLADQDMPPFYIVRLIREAPDGKRWSLDPQAESAGTNAMLCRLNDIAQASTGLLIIDEFDASLHPSLSQKLVELFTSAETNSEGRQLLFTAHTSSLLDVLRRDEIGLIEKEKDGASTVYAASDFPYVRSDRKSLSALYDSGQLGALPLPYDLAFPVITDREGSH